MTRPRIAFLFGLVALAGCAAPGLGTISMDVTISGGQPLRLDVDSRGGFIPQENADVRMGIAMFRVDGDHKQGFYLFSFTEKKNEAPRKVTVEDVSDEVPVTLAVDTLPELKGGKWSWETRRFEANEKNLGWIYQIENGTRVFRFTILTKDGRTLVMYGAQNYQAVVKSYMRVMLGIDKPPKPPGSSG